MRFSRKELMKLLRRLIDDDRLLGHAEFIKGRIFAYGLILRRLEAYDSIISVEDEERQSGATDKEEV